MTNQIETRTATDNEPAQGPAIRHWVIAALIVLTVALYPLGHWMWGSDANGLAAQNHLQASLEHYRAARYEEALAAARAALAADPGVAAEAHNNIAVAYLGLRRFDEAMQSAQEALRLRPDYQLARNNLAWIQQERNKAARTANSPDAATILLNQSLADAQAGRFKECMSAAAESARLDPTSARAFSNLGFCAGRLQLWDEGIRHTEEAIRLAPQLQLAKNNLAWLHEAKARSSAAR